MEEPVQHVWAHQNMQTLKAPRGVDLEVLGHRDRRCP